MEGFAAFISTTQAIAYTLAVAKSLAELRTVLKHGSCFLHDEKTSVGHLQEIITRLVREEETDVDLGLYHLLQSIEITVTTLLDLFRQQKRRHLIYTLVVRRTELNDSFASLERKKNTLILHLTAQNSAAISSLKTSTLAHCTRACQMSMQTHSSVPVSTVAIQCHCESLKLVQDSAYASLESSEYQPSKRTYQEGEGTLVAQKPPTAPPEHQRSPRTDQDGGGTPDDQHSPIQHKQAESMQPGAGRSPPQQHQTDPSTKADTKFYTERNSVKNKSEQTIYRHEGDDAKHVGNSSEDNSKQSIGSTFVVPAPEAARDSHCICS